MAGSYLRNQFLYYESLIPFLENHKLNSFCKHSKKKIVYYINPVM